MPGDPADVGNWLEPLGLAALITEGIVVILAGLALVGQTGPRGAREVPRAPRRGAKSE